MREVKEDNDVVIGEKGIFQSDQRSVLGRE